MLLISCGGIQALLGMQYFQAHFEKIKTERIHVVKAGYMVSDNLEMNLILDSLLKQETFNIVECSGFTRVKR